MNKKFINIAIFILSITAVFVIGYTVGQNRVGFTAPVTLSTQKDKVNLIINDGDLVKGYADINLPSPPSVLEVLETVSQSANFSLVVDHSSSLGAFVKQIGDKVNGDNQRYWQYWVDGRQPMTAADKYVLQGGETVLWTFSKSQY